MDIDHHIIIDNRIRDIRIIINREMRDKETTAVVVIRVIKIGSSRIITITDKGKIIKDMMEVIG